MSTMVSEVWSAGVVSRFAGSNRHHAKLPSELHDFMSSVGNHSSITWK